MDNLPTLEELFELADKTVNDYLTDDEKQRTRDELNKLAQEIRELVDSEDLDA